MSEKKRSINRRDFLHTSGCAFMGYTTLLSSLVSLKTISAAAASNTSKAMSAPSDQYKALVCVMLDGGNDSFNMLVPRGQSEYQQYRNSRANLALSQGDLLPINILSGYGGQLGLHPSMPRLQSMVNLGKASFVANVGALVEKIPNVDAYFKGERRTPTGLFSHYDQSRHWQTGIPQQRSPTGWGGRVADLIQDMNSSQEVSMNISLSGRNIFQTGEEVSAFSITSRGGGLEVKNYNAPRQRDQIRKAAIDSLMSWHYQDMFRNAYAGTIKTAQNMNTAFGRAIESAPQLETGFSDTRLSRDLGMIAKAISIHQELDATRQIFFVSRNGFDFHDGLLSQQRELLKEVDDGLFEFQTALEELGLEENVTTFTISDFGRNLTSNGDGTDHAWGGNALVMGGAVNGQRVFGEYPELVLGNSLDVGGGVFIPTTSTDEYFAELALWFGVSPSDLEIVFPNIRNFYSPESGVPPLGFLS